jgi:GNAT superfamily N-acetyltransferase
VSSLSTRDARVDDHALYLRLFPELGVPDPPASPDEWARDVMPAAIVVERDGDAIGYGSFRLMREDAHVSHLIVDPRARRGGVGEALMLGMASRMTAAGYTRWRLNVKVGNVAAIGLYERMGMRVAVRSTSIDLPWIAIAQLPRDPTASSEIVAEPLDASEDDAIETAFGFASGRLSVLRGVAALVDLRLRDRRDPSLARVGVARCDPSFPGMRLFAVAHPTLAPILLEAVRPRARAEDTSLHIFVEGDPDLAHALLDAGGTELFAVLQMRGLIGDARAPS